MSAPTNTGNDTKPVDDELEPTFDDVIGMFRRGELRKVRIIGILAEGGIREYEFDEVAA